ncbi:KAP-like [Commensalibacter communis]|uniref:KAP family P-loop NTPase fold protein n=1 Tax=Commensalibacter communis TaxID=2972786 RepID=UPI0022FFC190|nr:P-loop NTPase fold protein [Commensalibacter communis]CAI3955857.1 KAP-like [Commensalibacter communis]CAI3956647.1 KAP-like [Commensalibacter communis]
MNDISANSLSADSPITDLAGDCLGYSPFAKNIATILDNATTREDCLVLGIHGEWGSGKTSAINLVIEHLKWLQRYRPKYTKFKIFNDLFLYKTFEPDRSSQIKETKPRTTIIHFSPWLFSNQENLTTAFFHELEKQLDNSWGNIKAFLKTIAALTLPSLEALSYLNPATSKMVGNTTQLLIKNLQKRPSLEQTKQALNKALKAQKRPLLIIIDGIDRLPADEMRQIFRLVKSVADLPYVTYLLGFDRKIVERALEKDTDPEEPQWIEKIVQGSFELPKISPYKLKSYFEKQFNVHYPHLYKEIHNLHKLYFEKFVYPELTTCRQINRLINTLIFGRQGFEELVSISELIIITTWRLYNPKLYQFIKDNKKLFCTTFNPKNPKIRELESIITDQNLLKEFKECFIYETAFEELELSPSIKSSLYFDNYFTYDDNPGELLPNKFLIDTEHYILHDIGGTQYNLIKLYQTTTETGSNKAFLLLQEWQNNIQFYRDKKIEKIIRFLIISTHNISKKIDIDDSFFTQIHFFISQCFQSISTPKKKKH